MTGPLGRPFASSADLENPSMSAATAPVTDVTDARTIQRVSSSRLADMSSSLTLNDAAVLRFLAAAKFATGTQLARRLWDSEDPSDPAARAARRTLSRLEDNRLIGRHNHRVGGVRAGSSSIVYRLESAGRRLIGVPGKPARTDSFENLVHTLLVTELVVQVHERTAHGELEVAGTEWEPSCWRAYASSIATTATLRPDLFLVLAGPHHSDRWFVEVDRATERPARIRAKARRYLDYFQTGTEQQRHGVFPRVVWTAPDEARRDLLARTLHGLEPVAKRLFVVWLFEEAAGRLVAEGNA